MFFLNNIIIVLIKHTHTHTHTHDHTNTDNACTHYIFPNYDVFFYKKYIVVTK